MTEEERGNGKCGVTTGVLDKKTFHANSTKRPIFEKKKTNYGT